VTDVDVQLDLPALFPANDNDRKHNWHQVKLSMRNLATLYLMEEWCYANIGSDQEWDWNWHGAHSFWRFYHARDFMMFELTWG